jgi:hypothetical protein
MSDIKKSYYDKFTFFVMEEKSIMKAKMDVWLDERSKKEDNLIDRAIELEDENTKLKDYLGRIIWNKRYEINPPWDTISQEDREEFIKEIMEDI